MKNSADVQWANPTAVGVANYSTYQGRPVILATTSLNSFRSYM